MHTVPIAPHRLQPGDKIIVIMNDEPERQGIVTANHTTARILELVGDNFVAISLPYRKIERAEKFESDPGDPGT